MRDLGCDLAQGPLLGASLAIEEAHRLASEDFSLAEATGSPQMLPGLAHAAPSPRVRQSSS